MSEQLKRGDSFTEEEFEKLNLKDTGRGFGYGRIYKINQSNEILVKKVEDEQGIIRRIITFIFSNN